MLVLSRIDPYFSRNNFVIQIHRQIFKITASEQRIVYFPALKVSWMIITLIIFYANFGCDYDY